MSDWIYKFSTILFSKILAQQNLISIKMQTEDLKNISEKSQNIIESFSP